jgi:hypothetical protein
MNHRTVMAGLVPAIHVFLAPPEKEDVDARHKAGHDERRNLLETNRWCGDFLSCR